MQAGNQAGPPPLTAFTLNVRNDFRRFSDTLNHFQRTQLPFAAAKALTKVAQEVAAEQTKALETNLDRPVPFTKRAFGVLSARKTSLSATVFAKDIQAGYLQRAELGGTRLPEKKAVVVPAQARLTGAGNIPKGAVKASIASNRVFIGTIKGKAGVWQRLARSKRGQPLKLLYRFKPRVEYRPQLGYRERLAPLVARSLPGLLGKAMEDAMRSARR